MTVRRAILHRVLPGVAVAVAVAGLTAAPAAAAGACRYTIEGNDLDAAGLRIARSRSHTIERSRWRRPDRAARAGEHPGPVLAGGGARFPAVANHRQFVDRQRQPGGPGHQRPGPLRGARRRGHRGVPAVARLGEDRRRDPLATVPGAIGAGVAVLGVALLLASLRAAAGAGRGGAALGAIGGAMAGAGALVVAQQAGVTPLDVKSLALWTVPRPSAARCQPDRRRPPRVRGRRSGRDTALVSPMRAPSGADVRRAVRAFRAASHRRATSAAASEPEFSSAAEPTAGSAPPGADMASAPPGADTGATAGATSGAEPEPPRVSSRGSMHPTPWWRRSRSTSRWDCPASRTPSSMRRRWCFRPGRAGRAHAHRPAARGRVHPRRWRRGPMAHRPAGDRGRPHPIVVVRLRAEAAGGPVRGRQIRATYSVDGQVMGTATRQIGVVDDAARLADVEPPEPKAPATLSTPRGEDAPDLTITIDHRDGQESGHFWLQMLTRDGVGSGRRRTPSPSISVPIRSGSFAGSSIPSARSRAPPP